MVSIISAKINIFEFTNNNNEKVAVDNVELIVSKSFKTGRSLFNEVGYHVESYKVSVDQLGNIFGVPVKFPSNPADRLEAVREYLMDKVFRDCYIEVLVDTKGKSTIAYVDFID